MKLEFQEKVKKNTRIFVRSRKDYFKSKVKGYKRQRNKQKIPIIFLIAFN